MSAQPTYRIEWHGKTSTRTNVRKRPTRESAEAMFDKLAKVPGMTARLYRVNPGGIMQELRSVWPT